MVRACETFLSGRYAEHVLAHGQGVPVWAWTNLLAHGSADDLGAARTAGDARAPDAVRLWYSARSYLSAEVLDRVSLHRVLSQLQADVLIPLELELASCRATAWWEPSELVAAALLRLGVRRPSQRLL